MQFESTYTKCMKYGMCQLFQCTIFYLYHAQYYYLVGIFTADKFNTGVFASDIFILAKLQSGVFTGGITEWSFWQQTAQHEIISHNNLFNYLSRKCLFVSDCSKLPDSMQNDNMPKV